MRTLLALLITLMLGGLALSQTGDTLPVVPRGFDEGRTLLLEEAEEGLISPADLVNRMFEHASLHELSLFVYRHCTTNEKRALDTRLKLEGKLAATDSADATLLLFTKHAIKPADLRASLAAVAAEGRSLAGVVAWLYARGLNFRALQRAVNGERVDAFMLAANAATQHAGKLPLAPMLWQLNLADGRVEAGGVHDGVQLLDTLLHLGWRETEFADALGRMKLGELNADHKRAIGWGDPVLLWELLGARVPESELKRVAEEMLAATDPDKLLQVVRTVSATTLRWFRTGGGGIVDVYTGPWPDAKGLPLPPGPQLLPGKADPEEPFDGQFTDEVLRHFAHKGDTLTLVIYDDGSARAFIRRSVRPGVARLADSPLGGTRSATQLYEGRITLRGRAGLLSEVYAHDGTPGPAEVEFVNVEQQGNGALLVADLDDGVNLTPILLRRASRLIACE